MKIAFNEATTLKNSTLIQDLELCEKYGYDYIEIRLDKLKEYMQERTVEDLKQFFIDNRIKPYAFNALEFITFREKEDWEQIIQDLSFLCEVGEQIDCRKIVAVPTFDIGEYTLSEIKKETVKALKELSDIAEPKGIRIAFEFVGYPNCSVNTLGQTIEIINEVNKENVGIVLDCFHFYAMNSRLEDLQKIDRSKIFIFHIDDSEDLPFGALRDHNRVWPGEGVVDLESILTHLIQIGYDEMVSIEIFRPEYWELSPEETIKIAKEKTVEIISRYFEV